MKIVFLGSPEFANPSLRALVQAGLAPELVVTQPPARRNRRGEARSSPVGEAAKELGLPLLEEAKVSVGDAFDQIAAIKPDIAVVVAFGQILRKSLLALPKHGCINLHPSMLPKYRGAAPINWAMIDGVRESGITVMRLVKKLDAGPVLLQRPFEIREDEVAAEALDRSALIGAEMIVEVVQSFASGSPYPEVVQDETQASYAGLFKKEDGALDFNLPANRVWDRIRGVQPWPGAYAQHLPKDAERSPQRLIFWRAKPDESNASDAEPGTIIEASSEGVRVACARGTILLTEIQREGKPRRAASDFLSGYAIAPGERFEQSAIARDSADA